MKVDGIFKSSSKKLQAAFSLPVDSDFLLEVDSLFVVVPDFSEEDCLSLADDFLSESSVFSFPDFSVFSDSLLLPE
jgi:hypothetical protein